VRLRTGIVAGTVAVAMLIAAVLAPLPAVANPSVSIRILFDLGDGVYAWANETIADPEATNATWEAVQRAASSNGIAIDSAWFACCGVAIFDLGLRHPPAGFVGLLEWNGTAHEWSFTSTGISGLVVQDGAVIALYNAAFASNPPYASRTPVPSPDRPRPSSMFRSDLANSGVAGSAPPDRVRVLWDRDTGKKEIGSTPAVAYGKVFVETMGGMFAIDEESGEILWTNLKAKGFSSPAVFNRSVYVGTSAGTMLRLSETDGTPMWETRLLAQTNFTGISSSPKVVFDWVFVGTFNETGGPGEVVALWEGNGTVAWRHGTASIHFSSPAYADQTVYIGVMGRYNTTTQVSFDPPFGVIALDATTGDERWSFPTEGSVAASPTLYGPYLVVPSKDGKVYVLNRTTGTPVWTSAVDAGVSSAAVSTGTVYVGGGAFGGSGRIVALDMISGSERWSFAPNGPVQASITYGDDRIVFATNSAHGTVYSLNATSGTLEWSFEPLPAEYILGSPVIADGVVFAPSDNGHVYALGEAPPGQSPPDSLSALAFAGIVLVTAGIPLAVAVWILLRRRRRGP